MKYLHKVHETLEKWSKLGTKTLKNGTRLIGHVPHVGPEAYLHEIFAPLTDSDVQRLQKKLPQKLPTEFEQFLSGNNGLNMFSTTFCIYGLRRGAGRTGESVWQPFDIAIPNTLERPRDAKPSFLFLGGYNWDGSRVYIDLDNHKVFRCAVASARPLNEWRDFPEMLVAECDRIASFFDEAGRETDPEEPTTP